MVKRSNGMKNDHKKITESLISMTLLQILIFVTSFLFSSSVFGPNFKTNLYDVSKKVTSESELELAVLSNLSNNNEDELLSMVNNQTSDTPFNYCASRVIRSVYNDKPIAIIDVPKEHNQYYSYNHIYSESAWKKMERGTIVLSRDFYESSGLNEGDNISIPTQEKSLEFTVVGYCDGTPDSERNRIGNVLADFLGQYAVVLRDDVSNIPVQEVLKTINCGNMTNRDVDNEVIRWLSDNRIDAYSTVFSNKKLNDLFAQSAMIHNSKYIIPISIISGVLLTLLVVFYIYVNIADSMRFKIVRYSSPFCVLLVFIGLTLLFIKSPILNLLNVFYYSSVGGLIIPIVVGTLLFLLALLCALKNEKYFDFENYKQNPGKKTIWILNHYATTPSNGPLPRHYYLAKRFIKNGYNVVIFASNQLHATNSEVRIKKGKYQEVDENGVKFVFLKTFRYKGNGIKRMANIASFYFALLFEWDKIARKHGKPDIIIASSAHLWTCSAGLSIAKELSIPCICEVRDLWPEELFTVGKVKEKSLFGRYLSHLEKTIYRKADALVFTKEGDVDHIKEMHWDKERGGNIDLKKCFYINNGVDFDEWNNNLKNYKYALKQNKIQTFNVGYSGSIRPMNSVDLLIETADILRNEKDIMFYIAGSGSLLQTLKADAKSRKLTNVHFTGYLDKKYMPSFLEKMNLNVLVYSNSMYNWARGNSSNKLFEYMASGHPVISTVKMGYSIVNKYKCGIELDECSPEYLAKAILKYKKMSKKQYVTECVNAINGSFDFDFDVHSLNYIGIINKLLYEFDIKRKI